MTFHVPVAVCLFVSQYKPIDLNIDLSRLGAVNNIPSYMYNRNKFTNKCNINQLVF